MALEKAKQTWQNADESDAPSVSDETLLRLVKKRADAFDRQLRRRNRIEGIAGAVVFLFFSTMLVDPSWVVRIGAIIVLASTVLISWTLRRARTRPTVSSSARPVADAIRRQRERVDRQIRLLDGVLWWYIAPLATGILMVVVGDEGLSAFTLAYSGVVCAVAAVVYALNKRTVRTRLRPRRNELTRRLEEIEDA